ncbi:class F sortase [Actinoplanes sp. NPDC026619]|uniref:class F sortase n=1 Tax=Actinoplanes sp. NPDC026619 TaxID=3155798 RepID=UPI0033FF400A
MSPHARLPALATLAVALLAVLGLPDPAPRAAKAAAPAAAGPQVVFHSDRTYDAVAAPVRLRIPALGVDSKVQQLGLQPDGTIAVPDRTDVAGWFAPGARPGQPGPAVILGHVDSTGGPGIFIRLATVRPGATVRVDRSDGTSATFRITKVSRVPKVRFPTDLVYAPTLDPTLRLVTCGGSFDRTRGSYRDNVIAFADLA